MNKMIMYCQAALPLGDKKTFTRIGAMTRTIAMSYACSMNPKNWEAIAIFVCLDNFCSAIRTQRTELPQHIPTLRGRLRPRALSRKHMASTRTSLVRSAHPANYCRAGHRRRCLAVEVTERHWIGGQVTLSLGCPLF